MDLKQNSECFSPELWGGIECTINRTGDSYSDQLSYTPFYKHSTDHIRLFAESGIKAIRFPVLWEYHQPCIDSVIDLDAISNDLNVIRQVGMEPVIGFVHHGSGPAYADFTTEKFADSLQRYAEAFAVRFPWVKYYTPVNEPMTTARFSGLYGLWYPHKKDDLSFFTLLLNQLKAVVMSMQSIRKINPEAQLVQTEDLAKTYSTPHLQYQADFDNERRWLTTDLLCSKITEGSVMWNYLIAAGISVEQLTYFINNPCPPDIAGANYYITSERYLDENVNHYPPHTHGGNRIEDYADVEAVRISHGEPSGPAVLLRELWDRYHIPLAVTEVHLGCTREEQSRWFIQIWNTANQLASEGIPIKGVTAWALYGSCGWDKLLTDNFKSYESGVFDLRAPEPRKTVLFHLLKRLAAGEKHSHDIFNRNGWWNKEGFLHAGQSDNNFRPILITGKTGTLGQAFAAGCDARNIDYVILSRDEMDICDEKSISAAIEKYNPWAIINAAGYVKVDEAEADENYCSCYQSNSVGAAQLALACRINNLRYITFSSDLVFDGTKDSAYHENDSVNPLNVYGQSKADAEQLVRVCNPSSLIIRTSAFFGPSDRYNFAYHVLKTIAEGQEFFASDKHVISPTYIPDLIDATLTLLFDEEEGIWHLSNKGSVSWYEFAKMIASAAGFSPDLIKASTPDYIAARPFNSVLTSIRGWIMPGLQSAVDRFIIDRNSFTANHPVATPEIEVEQVA